MNADRAAGSQGWWVRLVGVVINLSSWHGQPILCYSIAVVSFLSFHAQDYITRIVTSEKICSSESFMEKVIWLLPKLQTDCEMIATTLASHPNADIAIIFDIWLFIVFFSSIILGMIYAVMILRKYREPSHRQYSFWKKMIVLSMYMIVIPSSTWMVLFHSVLVVSGSRWWGATLASHGIGVVIQTLIAALPYLLFSEYYHNRLIKWSDKS